MTLYLTNNKAGCSFAVKERAAGIYVKNFSADSDTVYSSIFVKAMDPGTTLQANYFYHTVGSAHGEKIALGSHALVSEGSVTLPYTDSIYLNGHHHQLSVEVTVTGGNVTFGGYASSSEATLLDTIVSSSGDLSLPTKNYGLCRGARMKEIIVDENWTPLAGVPFTRNAIAIQHKHKPGKPSDVKINWLPDVNTVGYVGMLMEFGEERQYDIQDNLVPYARVENAGKAPVTLYVEEIE